ncbi:F-box/LRR-repeat protein 20-like [Bolinopsis microptera]|uniref:F-box/LRR-repeat protein 20-like n=1 Tax=Bolinopsis microptera TaxID=2820187 RepID=UPI003078FD67
MVCTRSQSRIPLAEMTVEHAHKRSKTVSTTQTSAQSPDEESTSEDGFDEARENYPPSEDMIHICTPKTPRTGIYHTEWISSPFWRQSLSNDRVNRWETSADEVVLKIFSYLKFEDLFRCALVCRHWRALSYDRLLWTQFNLTQRAIPFDKLLTVLGYGTKYLSLSCGDVKERTAPSPRKRRESILLEYADFGLCNILPTQLSRLLDCAPNLVKLNLESVTISGPVLRAVAQCSQLQILNLAMCQNVNASQLVAVTRNCTKLKELNMAWCNISEKTYNRLFPLRCVTMEKLNISGGRDTVSCETIRLLSSNLPNLTSLDISDCIRINRYALAYLAKNCPRLEELSCSRVYELSSLDVLSWAFKMNHLKYFNSFPSIINERFMDFKEKMKVKFPHVQLNKKDTSDIARPCTTLHVPKGVSRLWERQFRV